MKIGVIPFLNVKPLIYELEMSDSVELVYDYPSKLSELLKNGKIDVGIIPIIDYFRGIGKYIIPNISISSDKKAGSVKLFYKNEDISNIKTVAIDKHSSTSVALLKIILKEVYFISPEFRKIEPVLPNALEENDAVLLIGNLALMATGKNIDLGEEWYKLTQLPFVYACWVIRDGIENCHKIVKLLTKSKEFGLKNLDMIIKNESKNLVLNSEMIEEYLRQIMQYDFRRPQLKGLLKFIDYAIKYKLIDKEREIEFYTPSDFRYGVKRREIEF